MTWPSRRTARFWPGRGRARSTSGTSPRARKWDWLDGRPFAYSDALGFSPDGKTLVSAGLHQEKDDPKTLHAQLTVWDIATAKERASIAIPGYSAPNAPPFVFTADGKTLITAVWIFEADKGQIMNGRL